MSQSEPTPPAFEGSRAETLLGGQVVIRQSPDGYRAGMDAALLAAACGPAPGERAARDGIELGCGPGAALLQVARRQPDLSLTGLEIDPAALSLAHDNIAANGLADRVSVHAGDIAAGFAATGLERAGLVFCNPPFFDDPARMRAPKAAREQAWMNTAGLAVWCAFALAASRDGGQIVFIHRADRLYDLLNGLSPKAGAFQIRPVQSFAGDPAKRVIVRAQRLGKAPLRLLAPLVLHTDRTEADGSGRVGHSPEAEAILYGRAGLEWL